MNVLAIMAVHSTGTSTNTPVAFQAQRIPGSNVVVLRTDTIRPGMDYDSVQYFIFREPNDPDSTADWLSTSGKVTFTVALRSCATGNILRVVDTITATEWDLDTCSRFGKIDLNGLHDSLIYVTITADTTNIAQSGMSSMEVQQEYAPPGEGGGMGKAIKHRKGRATPNDNYINPIFVEGWPQPIKPPTQGTISFTVPDADAGENCLVRITDMFGHTIETLIDEPRSAGKYSVTYSTERLASKMYIAEIRLAHDVQCKLIVVAK